MSKIIVIRKSEYNNRLRSIGIYLDGQKLDVIANGETKTFDIPEGKHQLRAKVDWCGSREQEFSIGANETKYFGLSGFRFGNFIMPAVGGLILLNFTLKRLAGIDYLIWFSLPVLLVLVYYLTFGRNDYLVLKERESWMG